MGCFPLGAIAVAFFFQWKELKKMKNKGRKMIFLKTEMVIIDGKNEINKNEIKIGGYFKLQSAFKSRVIFAECCFIL